MLNYGNYRYYFVHPSTGSEFVNLFLSVVSKESMEEDFPPLGRFSPLYRSLAVVI